MYIAFSCYTSNNQVSLKEIPISGVGAMVQLVNSPPLSVGIPYRYQYPQMDASSHPGHSTSTQLFVCDLGKRSLGVLHPRGQSGRNPCFLALGSLLCIDSALVITVLCGVSLFLSKSAFPIRASLKICISS